MTFFNKKGKTAEQKAQWAKTRLMLRGAVLIYLVIFIIVPLMNPGAEDIDAINPVTRYIMAGFFIIACGGLLAVTVKDYFQGKKTGLFTPEAYTDDSMEDTNLPEKTQSDNMEDYEEYDDDHDENA